MTIKQLNTLVKKIDNERYDHDARVQAWEAIPNKLAACADLHAMNLIDRLVPGGGSISWATHDEFTLCVNLEELAKAATEAQIREICSCGFIIGLDQERVYAIR
jgi:hypothetical protein